MQRLGDIFFGHESLILPLLKSSSKANKDVACEQAFRGALAAGREKERELETASMEFKFQFPFGSPSTELSDFCQLARSGNECECKQTSSTNVISAKQNFASTFSIQIFKFQGRSCKLSFPFSPRRPSAPESLLAG